MINSDIFLTFNVIFVNDRFVGFCLSVGVCSFVYIGVSIMRASVRMCARVSVCARECTRVFARVRARAYLRAYARTCVYVGVSWWPAHKEIPGHTWNFFLHLELPGNPYFSIFYPEIPGTCQHFCSKFYYF